MKRKPQPHAKRPYAVEHYKHLGDERPKSVGYTMDIWGARVSAVKHLILGHAELAVCVRRSSGRVLWERVREGQNILYRPAPKPSASLGDVDGMVGSLEERTQ
jgi:hypothetical protein